MLLLSDKVHRGRRTLTQETSVHFQFPYCDHSHSLGLTLVISMLRPDQTVTIAWEHPKTDSCLDQKTLL